MFGFTALLEETSPRKTPRGNAEAPACLPNKQQAPSRLHCTGVLSSHSHRENTSPPPQSRRLAKLPPYHLERHQVIHRLSHRHGQYMHTTTQHSSWGRACCSQTQRQASSTISRGHLGQQSIFSGFVLSELRLFTLQSWVSDDSLKD